MSIFEFSQAELQQIVTIARQAGDAIMAVYAQTDLQVEVKQDDSPVTAADIASHNVIVNGLARDFSDIAIMSE